MYVSWLQGSRRVWNFVRNQGELKELKEEVWSAAV